MKQRLQAIRDYVMGADLALLLFLLAIVIDKASLKPVVILAALVYMWRGISWQRIKAIPLFYLLLPVMELLRFLFFNGDFSSGHTASFVAGELYWLMMAIAFLFLKYRTDMQGTLKLERTLIVFFYLNAIWSAGNLLGVMIASRSLNPYMLADLRFGNSTGDFIRGIFMAPCYINMFANAFFAIYFLFRRMYGPALLAVIIAVLTTCNFANMVFIPVLVLVVLRLKKKKASLAALGAIGVFTIFYFIVSPDNLNYAVSSTSGKGGLMKYGKVEAVVQTGKFLASSPAHALFGAGMGQFSSQLAIRSSHMWAGSEGSRLFQMLPAYHSPHFDSNHYQILQRLYSLPPEYHSVKHQPHSFLNQLLGEYGIVGLLLFLVFYVWYFLRRYRYTTYALWIGLLLAGFLLFDYLFEYLSIVLLFELFFLIDVKKQGEAHAAA